MYKFVFFVFFILEKISQGIPNSSVIKNLPANAGDRGSIPGPGRSHMMWSHKTHVLQLLSLCSRAQELQLLNPQVTTTKPLLPGARDPQVKPLQ